MKLYRRLPVVKCGVAIFVVAVVTTFIYFLESVQEKLRLIQLCVSPDVGLLTNNLFDSYIAESQEKKVNSHDITIVTLFVNIGRFQKGTSGLVYTPDMYKNWMKTWGWLTNRVIAFFDSDETLNLFRRIRSFQPEDRTVLIRINRSDIPTFNNLETVRRIFDSQDYPKHPPNTVVPEYSLAMNAKHDALQMALTRGLVHTKYMAWLDIGLFRHLLDPSRRPKDGRFTLEVPDNFNPSCVGMSEVTPREYMSTFSAWDYIRDNRVWVGGAFLLGTKETVWLFSESYKQMVARLLEQNMSSTDQQVIGAMYSPDYVQSQKVCLNAYKCYDGQFQLYGSDVVYFCLAYMCKA